ncbi:MAG: DNA repair protein [Clostridia bacterium]|nr:DNA repair protein [Clostridia bacterium]
MESAYLCIDLKSFYASVECVERGLDPMTARLVVADPERSDKTICLAVSPALRALGVRNRCRVFEIPRHIDYITAPPRMKLYVKYAADIYSIYLSYFSKEDIHVYSIDECFIDVTRYLRTYQETAHSMAHRLMEEIRQRVGVRATCGIGSNLYLAKVALDVLAKHADDFIATLDETSFRERLWDHRPLTDFWRIGHGTAERLARVGVHTMRQLAAMDEDVMYRMFGVDAELLLDHANGRESVTIADIRAYQPKNRCMTSGQVLMRDYTTEEGRLIVREMADLLALDLVGQDSLATGASLSVGFAKGWDTGGVHGSVRFARPTASDRRITEALVGLYDRLVHAPTTVRRFTLTLTGVFPAEEAAAEQIGMFDDPTEDTRDARDAARQRSMLTIKRRFGKDAILKGMNFEEAATTRERNHQIGGHKAGD